VSAPLLNAEQVAERIGMTTDFVYRLAREKRIPHLKFGRTLRFRAEAIEDWIEKQEQEQVR
jgi:excisionase family DNA binding protein